MGVDRCHGIRWKWLVSLRIICDAAGCLTNAVAILQDGWWRLLAPTCGYNLRRSAHNNCSCTDCGNPATTVSCNSSQARGKLTSERHWQLINCWLAQSIRTLTIVSCYHKLPVLCQARLRWRLQVGRLGNTMSAPLRNLQPEIIYEMICAWKYRMWRPRWGHRAVDKFAITQSLTVNWTAAVDDLTTCNFWCQSTQASIQ